MDCIERMSRQLAGKKILKIRKATAEELEALGLNLDDSEVMLVIELEDGTCLAVASDQEGNGAGWLHQV